MTAPFVLVAGLIAFLQVTILPGILVSRTLKLQESTVPKILVIFGTSLMTNYWVIFLLTSVRLYTPFSLVSLTILEIVLLLYPVRSKIIWMMRYPLVDSYLGLVSSIQNSASVSRRWLHDRFMDRDSSLGEGILLALVVGSCVYAAMIFFSTVGTVFNLNDPIVSWNRWAVEWSMNGFPHNTWEYPQLIPVNWSIFYILIGIPVQYFPKILMPLFFIGIILTFLFEGIRQKRWAYLVAIPATILLMRLLNGSAIMAMEGYVDTAVAFFATLSLTSIFWSDNNASDNVLAKNLLVGAVSAVGAAMTKEAGLFIVLLYPILAWIFVVRKNERLRKKLFSFGLLYVGAIIIGAGPFYLYKELAISADADASIVPVILNLMYSGGKSVVEVLLDGLWYLVTKTHGVFLGYVVLLPFAWRYPPFRWIIGIVLIPYTLLWGMFWSYDTRNLSRHADVGTRCGNWHRADSLA